MRHVIMGTPQQQERPRAACIRGKVRIYDPPKSRAAKDRIKQHFSGMNIVPSEKPLMMIIYIFVPIPKSYTKKQRAAIESGDLRPAKKPDVSNYIKLIEDACNGILYKDDSQIVELRAKKFYSDSARIEIEVVEM